MKNFARTFLKSIRDFFKVATAPIRSLFAINHHKNTSHLNTPTVDEKAEQDKNLPKKQTSRNIYLSDLDDSFISWNSPKQSAWQKFKHRAIFRPHDEDVTYFPGAQDFIKRLNSEGVRTALVSNKDHHKLLKQAQHHRWDQLFEHVVGHDRGNSFHMHKPNGMTFFPTADLPLHAIKKLLGKKALYKGMEPINVVFVGDNPMQDMAVARLLDKKLKKLNPKSSCTAILLTNDSHQELDRFPSHRRPDHVAKDYADIEKFTNMAFGLQKAESSPPPKDKTQTLEQPAISQVDALAKREAEAAKSVVMSR